MSDPIPVIPVVPTPQPVKLPSWVPLSLGTLILGVVIGAVGYAVFQRNETPVTPIPDIALPETIALDPSGAPVKLQATLKDKTETVTWLIPKWVKTSPKYKNFEYADHQLLSGTGGDFDLFGVIVSKGKTCVAETHVIGANGPTPGPPPGPGPGVDPLVKSFQDAYNKDVDADKAKSLSFLQAIYPMMASGLPSPPPTNNAVFKAWMMSKVQSPVGGLNLTQLVNLRKAIDVELTSSLGTDPNTLVNVTTYPAELKMIGDKLSQVK